MAEMVGVEFEYLSNGKSQDLCGGGEHAGSELVSLSRWGRGQVDEGEGVLKDISMPYYVLLIYQKHCNVTRPLPQIY